MNWLGNSPGGQVGTFIHTNTAALSKSLRCFSVCLWGNQENSIRMCIAVSHTCTFSLAHKQMHTHNWKIGDVQLVLMAFRHLPVSRFSHTFHPLLAGAQRIYENTRNALPWPLQKTQADKSKRSVRPLASVTVHITVENTRQTT